MRINQMNFSNYAQMMRLFSGMNGKNTKSFNPFGSFSNDTLFAANRSKRSDEYGEIVNSQGVSGMCVSGKSPSEYQQIVGVSEDGKQKLFDMVKSEFIENNGVLNGDTTRKSEVYAAYQKSIPKEDRLKATWTLGKLEQEYRNGLIAAAKKENPGWNIGQRLGGDALSNVTRASVSGAIDGQSRKGIDTQA